jgi:hypothetical protein
MYEFRTGQCGQLLNRFTLDSGRSVCARHQLYLPQADRVSIISDYNLGNTIHRLCYLLAEVPAQVMAKWLGADRWVPFQMTSWSIIALCQFWLSGRTSFLCTRALLGLLSGGFVPTVSGFANMVSLLSSFITDDPLPFLLLQTSRAFHTSRLLVHSSFFCGHPRWFSRFWDSAPTGSWWARRLALAVLD